ncbi:MAG TPA: hypothetical protein PLO78_05450 [Candidatus Omnitrophota bacterium]|nr:hypothetical protein [Candidatus Omnitrophota bacterium]
MKPLRAVFLVFILLALLVLLRWTCSGPCGKDTPVDRAGDLLAIMGKKGMQKNAVLIGRKTGRWFVCVQKQTRQTAKAFQNLKRKSGF